MFLEISISVIEVGRLEGTVHGLPTLHKDKGKIEIFCA